jgi:pyruvate formate lyase activating enzyme
MSEIGRIFAIKKYAIHDGPAIRTTVFFKGCPLRCAWCHNPEGMSDKIQILWIKSRCAGCGICLDECKAGALSLKNHDIIRDTLICTGCGHCVEACPCLAHEATGWEVGVDGVMEEIKKDIPFFDQSGGGVTFSGGEPLFQPLFLMALLKRCKNIGIHRTIDTCAHAKTELLDPIAAMTDLFLIDIKHMDSDTHKKLTGVPNGLILENIRVLAGMKKSIRFRIPLIEGVNTAPENIEKTGRFIAGISPQSRVDLLPYHEMAASKYNKLGRALPSQVFEKPDPNTLDRCQRRLAGFGLNVAVGG